VAHGGSRFPRLPNPHSGEQTERSWCLFSRTCLSTVPCLPHSFRKPSLADWPFPSLLEVARLPSVPPTARVRILWGDTCLFDRFLPARTSFTLGEGRADFALPCDLLGAPQVRLVAARARELEVGVCPRALVEGSGATTEGHGAHGDRIPLLPDCRIVQRIGDLTFEVSADQSGRVHVARWAPAWRTLVYFTLSAAAQAVVLWVLARSMPPSELERTQERLALMRYYLRLSTQTQPLTDQDHAGTSGRIRKGDEAGIGLDLQTAPREHTRVQGPKDNPDPHQARDIGYFDAWPYLADSALLPPTVPLPRAGNLNRTAPSDRQDSLGLDEESLRPSQGLGSGAEWIRHGDRGAPRGDVSQRITHHAYDPLGDDPMHDPQRDAWSTFDVDSPGSSYLVARRELRAGRLPPKRSIQTEQFVNHFDYAYAPPKTEEGAFRLSLVAAPSPYDSGHLLLRVGVQARAHGPKPRPPVHRVYLPVLPPWSRSQGTLASLRQGLESMLSYLGPQDTVALCAGSPPREVLPPTGTDEIDRIRRAISSLVVEDGSSFETGLPLAYQVAERGAVAGHVTSVVVLSDGAGLDPIVRGDWLESITTHACRGVELSLVDVGQYANHESGWELASAGGGEYWHVVDSNELSRVLGDQIPGSPPVIAQDVAIRVEFDPTQVAGYRLLGFERQKVNRRDTPQVGCNRIRAGHSATAFYDLVLRQRFAPPARVRLRYREPDMDVVREIHAELRASNELPSFEAADPGFRWGVAAAGFAEILRGSTASVSWSLERTEAIARSAGFSARTDAGALPMFEPPTVPFHATRSRGLGMDPPSELVQLMEIAAELRTQHAR
jgi:Ca-activated chloride channel homolog